VSRSAYGRFPTLSARSRLTGNVGNGSI